MVIAKPAFSIEWLEANRSFLILVRQDLLTEMDVAEIQACSAEIYRKASRDLHVIIDIRNLAQNTAPDISGSLDNVSPISKKNHGATIIIVDAANPLLKFFAGATMEALERPFHLCSTMEEAQLILADLD